MLQAFVQATPDDPTPTLMGPSDAVSSLRLCHKQLVFQALGLERPPPPEGNVWVTLLQVSLVTRIFFLVPVSLLSQ